MKNDDLVPLIFPNRDPVLFLYSNDGPVSAAVEKILRVQDRKFQVVRGPTSEFEGPILSAVGVGPWKGLEAICRCLGVDSGTVKINHGPF